MEMVGIYGEDAFSGGGEPSGLGEKAKGSGVDVAGFRQQIQSGGGEDFALQTYS